jgi:serine/threonine protein kinase
MSADLARDARARARFLREARAAAVIEHENVVPIHHVGDDGGVPFIVMPLLRGESLDTRLKREGQLPLPEVIRLGRDVAAGLAAAHARGLVHRDVKPPNIWFDTQTKRAKLLDFGLARAANGTDRLTETGTIPGTPAYMAPETVDGHPADAQSDLFSLGATLYQCATGQPAFKGNDTLSILRSLAVDTPLPPCQLNPEVPPALNDLILRLLAKVPGDRPASAGEVRTALAALDAALVPRNINPDPPAPQVNVVPPRQISWRSFSRWAWWLLIFGLAAFTAGYRFAGWHRSTPPPAVWGWNKPEAVEPANSPEAYFNRLARLAEEWNDVAPPPDGPNKKYRLAVRLLELRGGCSRLVFAEHPLPPKQRQQLQDKAREWARKADELLQQLESNVRPELVLPDVEKLVRGIAADLRRGLGAP